MLTGNILRLKVSLPFLSFSALFLSCSFTRSSRLYTFYILLCSLLFSYVLFLSWTLTITCQSVHSPLTLTHTLHTHHTHTPHALFFHTHTHTLSTCLTFSLHLLLTFSIHSPFTCFSHALPVPPPIPLPLPPLSFIFIHSPYPPHILVTPKHYRSMVTYR